VECVWGGGGGAGEKNWGVLANVALRDVPLRSGCSSARGWAWQGFSRAIGTGAFTTIAIITIILKIIIIIIIFNIIFINNNKNKNIQT
jgi:hypothetical protein